MDKKILKDFNVFVGAETGLLKGLNISHHGFISKNIALTKSLDRDLEIVGMCWQESVDGEKILVGRRNKEVSTFDISSKSFTNSREYNCGNGPLVSICSSNRLFVAASQDGIIKAWRYDDENPAVSIDTVCGRQSKLKKRPATLCKVIQNPQQPNEIASGGNANDLRVWDLNSPNKCIFRAQNVPLNFLHLGTPIWVTDMTYMPENHLIACCTRYHHVRLYDVRVQKASPVISFEWGEYPLTCIAKVPLRDGQIVVGSSHGCMMTFDLRNPKPELTLGGYKGWRGGIKQIATLSNLPLLFTVSLDRFFRVHDSRSKRIITQEYLKSRLNCVLLSSCITLKDFGLSSSCKMESSDEEFITRSIREENEKQFVQF